MEYLREHIHYMGARGGYYFLAEKVGSNPFLSFTLSFYHQSFQLATTSQRACIRSHLFSKRYAFKYALRLL